MIRKTKISHRFKSDTFVIHFNQDKSIDHIVVTQYPFQPRQEVIRIKNQSSLNESKKKYNLVVVLHVQLVYSEKWEKGDYG